MKHYLSIYLLLVSVGVHAGVVKWVDANGNVHYSDAPPRDAQKLTVLQPHGGVETQTDFTVKTCQIVQSAFDEVEWAATTKPAKRAKQFHDAMRRVDPVFTLGSLYGEAPNFNAATIKTTLIEDATHGKISSEVDTASGVTAYQYDSEPKYTGRDRAVFMAEFEGKRYKIVFDLMVYLTAGEAEMAATPSWCSLEPQLTKVK